MKLAFDPAALEIKRNSIIEKYRRLQEPGELPREVHHYTNPDAAMKIVSGNSLRLFHASFCNDPTELDHGLNKMRDAAKALQSTTVLDLVASAADQLIYGRAQPFIFCLSQAKDSLPLWEMYSGRNGCFITFGPGLDKLCFKGPPAEGTMGSVIYDCKLQQGFANELCHLVDQYQQFLADPQFQTEALVTFINAAVFLKNPVFEHEREWRIVYMGGRSSPGAISYLPSTRFHKPYVEGLHSSLPVKSITIGPSDEQERLKRSVEHFIKMKGPSGVKVLESDTRLSQS